MTDQPIKLPGYGLPLDARKDLKYSVGKTEKFPIALIDEGYEAEMMPMRDYVIMELVNLITDKPDWESKVFDDSIVAKWRTEILGSSSSEAALSSAPANTTAPQLTGTITDHGASNLPDPESSGGQRSIHHATADVSPRMFDWIIAEVKYKARLFNQLDCVEALDGVWKSDSLISEELRQALGRAVSPLEDVPSAEKDWHPGSNGQVLDIVHPSIYPLVYGQSRVLNREICSVNDCTWWIGQGSILKLPSAVRGSEWSEHYQWLPTEFEVPRNTADVHVKSYINNLHPSYHSNLYSIISQVVAKAIPLWERVLSHVIAPPMQARVSDWSNSFQGYAEPEPRYQDGEYVGEYDDLRDVIEPEPGNFKTSAERIRDYKELPGNTPPVMPKVAPFVDLRKDHGRLQIIVKLANIHLRPDNPEYPGGSWHVEGQANEAICASALYYYDSDNITDSYLSFRQQTHDAAFRLDYPQGEWKAVERIYGFTMGEPAIQNLGKVLTRESRLLCFPNVMQHKVSPFKLADPTKPGHRKLLALFLVDPHIKIISTENVPPQQYAWWRENVTTAGLFEKLPPELAENVLNGVDFPVTLETTREQRLELMVERKQFALYSEAVYEDKTFN
ncbi:MAG: hypothetical protein Q9198_005576, partial [Flavoplaca austrocitrina]